MFRSYKTNFRGYTILKETLQFIFLKIKDSSAGIMTAYGLDGKGIGVRFPAAERHFYLFHNV
jgi:hypothetical protein